MECGADELFLISDSCAIEDEKKYEYVLDRIKTRPSCGSTIKAFVFKR